MEQALGIFPLMMGDAWISPLVTLIGSVDAVVQSAGLALLSKIIRTGTSRNISSWLVTLDSARRLCSSDQIAQSKYSSTSVACSN